MRLARASLCLALGAALTAPSARAGLVVRAFLCDGGGGATPAMENSYIAATGRGACWFHTGHHTYDLGSPHRLHRIAGSVTSVEQAFSPGYEGGRLRSVILEAWGGRSGTTWTTLGLIDYEDRVPTPFEFDFSADPPSVRTIRIREPRSLAQGLSGFLDASGFDATLEAPTIGHVPFPRKPSYACDRDVMERMFAEHPCWFGGVNRYDSPSVFHTYPIGPSALDAVSGHAIFLPWRTDDYFFDNQSPTSLKGAVQVSADGVTWATLGEISGLYGEPISFSFDGLAGMPASYARIVAEYHRGMFRPPTSNWQPLKHARGFLLDSALEVRRTS